MSTLHRYSLTLHLEQFITASGFSIKSLRWAIRAGERITDKAIKLNSALEKL